MPTTRLNTPTVAPVTRLTTRGLQSLQQEPIPTWTKPPNSLVSGWTNIQSYQNAWFNPTRYTYSAPVTMDPSKLLYSGGKGSPMRIGSFNLNLVDFQSMLSQWSGQNIGQRESMIPTMPTGTGGFDPFGWLASHGFSDPMNIPSRLVDPLVAIPLALMNEMFGATPPPSSLRARQPGASSRSVPIEGAMSDDTLPGNTQFYAYRKAHEYWNMIRSAKTPEELRAIAMRIASQSTVPGTPTKLLTSQLYDSFIKDWSLYTGYSSGDERQDYMAKKGLEYIMFAGPAQLRAQANTEWGLTNAALQAEAAGKALAGGAKTTFDMVGTMLPIVGTPLMEFLDPVSAEVEAAWRKLTPAQRQDLFGRTTIATLASDIVITLPLLVGWGAAMNVIRAGATSGQTVWSLSAMAQRASSASALVRNSQQLLYTAGQRAPILWTGYNALLEKTTRLMAAGMGVWGALWAAETLAPAFAGTTDNPVNRAVHRINAMYPVSDSQLAGYLNMIGIFSSGTYGASVLVRGGARQIRPIFGKALGMAELPTYSYFRGGSQMAESLGRYIRGNDGTSVGRGVFDNTFKVSYIRALRNVAQRDLLDTTISNVRKEAAEGTLQWLEGQADVAAMHYGEIIRRAREPLAAGADDAARITHTTLVREAREIERLAAQEMAATYNTAFFTRMVGRDQSIESYQRAIRESVAALGYQVDDAFLRGLGNDLRKHQQAVIALHDLTFHRRNAEMYNAAMGGGLRPAEEFDDILLARADELYGDRFRMFDEMHEMYLADPALMPEEFLRRELKQLIEGTSLGAKWWASVDKSSGLTLDNLPFDRFLRWGREQMIPGGLPERRLMSHDPSTWDLPLNQFHRALQREGKWVIAYKPRAANAEGQRLAYLRNDWEAQSNLFATWNAERDRVFGEYSRYIQSYFAPMAKMRMNQMQRPGILSSLRHAMEAQGNTPEAIAAAIRKAERDLAGERGRMTQLERRLGTQAEAARAEWGAFSDAPVPWRRSGEYAPRGFEVDPMSIPEIAQLFNLGQIDNPMLVHLTPAGPSVVARGLLSTKELDDLGIIGRGLGGARSNESSFTIEGALADEFQQRFVMAVRAARNEVEWDEMVNWLADRWQINDADDQLVAMLNTLDNISLPTISAAVSGKTPVKLRTWDIAEQVIDGRITNADEALTLLATRLDDLTEVQGRIYRYGQVNDRPAPWAEFKYNFFKYAEEMLANAPDGIGFNFVESVEKIGVHDPANVRAFRLSYLPEHVTPDLGGEFSVARHGVDVQSLEIAAGSRRLFAHTQPWDAPIEDFTLPTFSSRVETIPVSYVSDEAGRRLAAPFYEWNGASSWGVELGNRTIMGRKIDGVTNAFANWKAMDYQRGQLLRKVLQYEGTTPEQSDLFLARVIALARQPYAPIKQLAQHRTFQGVPLSPQAAGRLRGDEVQAIGNDIFGSMPLLNLATGQLEAVRWDRIMYQQSRQAAHLNFTASLTGRLKANPSALGAVSSFTADWLIPWLRFYLSPIFKGSEHVESWAYNAMRGVAKVSDDELESWARSGVRIRDQQLLQELGHEQYAQGLADPVLASTYRPDPLHTIGSVYDLPFGPFALEHQIHMLAAEQGTGVKAAAKRFVDAWMNPVHYKDRKSIELAISGVKRELPALLRRYEPRAYDLIHNTLGVPDDDIARFIVEDRMLFQRWLNGDAGIDDVIAHASRYKADALPVLEERGITFPGLYETEEWQVLEALMRIQAKTMQSEAFSIHYFGVYRNALERSLNHPMLGVYPLSWALKAAREWIRFLYNNRTFGDGSLRLGMAPAVAIKHINDTLDIWWAKRDQSAESWEEWLAYGPLGNLSFIVSLMLPGDWGSIPFPLSRPIRELVRSINMGQPMSPVDFAARNFFGPENRGGMGIIRDANLAWRSGEDLIGAMMDVWSDPEADKAAKQRRFRELIEDPTKVYTPVDWGESVDYPTTTLYP